MATHKAMDFGVRLAEERRRLGLKQSEFAALGGIDVPKQSLYENGRRELRAPYLARLPAAGVDLFYVLTASRGGGAGLSDGATALMSAYFGLPAEAQAALRRLVDDLDSHFG